MRANTPKSSTSLLCWVITVAPPSKQPAWVAEALQLTRAYRNLLGYAPMTGSRVNYEG